MEPTAKPWMNRLFLAWVLLLWTLPFCAHAQITNVLLTVTSAPTNGASISINGNVRTWATNVTNITVQLPMTTIWAVQFTNTATNGQSFTINSTNIWTATNSVTSNTNQFLVGTNNSSSATNFYTAYSNNPSAFTTVAFAPGTSNVVVIYSFFGVPLAVTNSPGVGGQAGGFANIYSTNDLGIAATNLYLAYGIYLVPSTMSLLGPGTNGGMPYGLLTNQVRFTSFPGYQMTVTLPSNGWASTVATGFTVTNLQAVVVPDGNSPVTVIGSVQRTNEEYGLIGLLNDFSNGAPQTNYILQTNTIWQQFLGTNFGQNSTNYASNLYVMATNYTWIQAENSTNYATNIYHVVTNDIGILGTNSTNYAFQENQAFGVVYTNTFAPIGSLPPWQDGSLNVKLSNELGVVRFVAYENGGMIGAGAGLYASDGSTLMQNWDNYGDVLLYDFNTPGTPRLQVQGVLSGNSNTLVTGGSGRGLTVGGLQGTVFGDRPMVMQSNVLPAVLIGTVTNFPSFVANADTHFNSNNLSGGAMTNAGDTVVRTIGMSFSALTGYQFQVNFNGTAILATPTFSAISGGVLSLRAEVTADGSGSFHWNVVGTGIDLTTNNFCSVGHNAFSGLTNFYITVQGTTNIIVEVDNEVLAPSSVWGYMP